MEYVRISENKVKLSLTEEDMKKYGVDVAALTSDTTARRRVLWTLLDETKKKTGVDAGGSRTLVEAFPGRRGGCELFVTLIDVKTAVHTACYRFESVASARMAAKRLAPYFSEKDASLYALSGGETVLLLPLSARGEARALTPYSFLEEYGRREKSPYFSAYVKEYGVCLYERDAVSRLCAEKTDFSV